MIKESLHFVMMCDSVVSDALNINVNQCMSKLFAILNNNSQSI